MIEIKSTDMSRERAISEVNQIYGMLAPDKQRALDVLINSVKVDMMYDLAEENADEFISKSVIEDIKAEIESQLFVGRILNSKDFDDGLKWCLDIIDKHISGKENE